MNKMVFIGMMMCSFMVFGQDKETSKSYLLVNEQGKDAFLEEMASFMETNSILYLATAETNSPCVRPVRFSCIMDNKLAIVTSFKKEMSKQMTANSAVELCTTAADGKVYLRFSGTAAVCKDETVIAKFNEVHPKFKGMFGKDFALYLITPTKVGLWGGKEKKTKTFKTE